jgi:cobalt/nickel transport system permease protein
LRSLSFGKQTALSGVVERTLEGINASLERSLFAERIARQPGFLQRLDPRLKLSSLLLLLLAVSLSRSLIVLDCLYLLSVVLAFVSKVPPVVYIKRVWLVVTLFTGVVALPAIFIVPGAVLVNLPFGLVITSSGVTTALFLLLRVGASVSLSVLVVLTTPWNSLLKALTVLRLPAVVILLLGMTYRYIHALLHITADMFLSRKSRLLRRMNAAEERHLAAATAGALLSKSLQFSGDVYLAMQSRGFRNVPVTLDRFKMKRLDWLSGAAVVLITAAAIWLGRG